MDTFGHETEPFWFDPYLGEDTTAGMEVPHLGADADIPEVRTLAATVDRWWNEIATFITTGHSNAKSEGTNRVIKLVTRAAFGFRNADHQRLHTRCVTTPRARRNLRTA